MTLEIRCKGSNSLRIGEEILTKKTYTVSLIKADKFVDEQRFEDIDAEIRKIDGEVRMLKRRQSSTPVEGGGANVGADEVQGIYDEISLLRDELVAKTTFESYKTKTDDRLDEIEAKQKEFMEEVKRMNNMYSDIMKLDLIGSGGNNESVSALQKEMKGMIDSLQDQVFKCHLKDEAIQLNDDLSQRLTALQEKVENSGAVISDGDVERWNKASVATLSHEKDIEKILKDLSQINAEAFLREMKNLNQTILTLASKPDLDKLAADVTRARNQVSDMDYKINNLSTKVEDIDAKAESFAQFFRIESGKISERIEKLESAIQTLKKILAKVTEQSTGDNTKVDMNQMQGVAKDEVDKINTRINNLQILIEKNHTTVQVALDSKVSLIDLQNVQTTLMDRLNELMRNLENMFADKEGTRKKLAQLEKAVSLTLIV